jgi:two-component system sensor histidine kinase PilS (NtrC family)
MSDRGAPDAGADSLRDESWFAALGLVRATRPAPLNPEDPLDAAAASPTSRRRRPRRHFIRQDAPASRPAADDSPTQTRIYRAFAVARALLGALMLLAQGLVHAYGVLHPSWPVIGLCGAYAVAAGLALRTPRSLLSPASTAVTLRKRWFVATVVVDLLCFGLLLGLIGPGLNIAALYALPVLMAASLTNRQVALGVAAVASLTMLGAASLQAAEAEATTSLMQAGLAGAGLFAIAALTGELAARLAREERTARNTLALARQQALLNRLVIEEMQDGVLVVDRQGHIRAANPAALAMIGAPVGPHPTRLRLQIGRAHV